ncbi:5'-adenylylsulfate reductase-like 7 [Aristolochia californica]|uniref:5'-adenylylsulfate reductase-like 7 n=1 Tax=Aristolochia californica TaxID=171875 RepID=UPI0035DC5281
MASLRFLLCICAVSTLRSVYSDASLCPPYSRIFLKALDSQCPLEVPPPTSIEVDGELLDWVLTSKQRNGYTSVLFYASWCPFSIHARSTYDVFSAMFPQITHLAVEESKVMPVIFSKYGIHSLPSILMVNQTSRIRYNGSKDLDALILFYQKTTGFEPVEQLVNEEINPGSEKPFRLLDGSSKDMLRREPYLIFSVVFLCLKGFLLFFPLMLSLLKAIWILCIWHLNFGILRGTSQLLERVLHVVNVKRAWSKLRLCKTRNFQNGAKNARVWASSLASVSLGDPSSSRSGQLES